MSQQILARYYLLPTIGRLSLCTVESGSSSHDYSAIYPACSSLARATTRLMVRAWKRLVLLEYQQTLTMLHPRLDVITTRYVQDITKNVCNRIQEKIKNILFVWLMLIMIISWMKLRVVGNWVWTQREC